MKTKHIYLIITIILLLVLGILAYQNIKTTGSILINNYDKGFDYNDYCEYDSETDTCTPENKCEFQIDSEGMKVCLGKY